MASGVTCLLGLFCLFILSPVSEAVSTTPSAPIQCPKNTYIKGSNCTRCGQCAANRTCDGRTGRCPLGCNPGYKVLPDTCTTACDNGRYGENCSQTCGHCAGNQNCHPRNGSCLQCQRNYQPPFCKDCTVGRWGADCSQSCGGCATDGGRCARNNGTCIQARCLDGWKGPACNVACDSRKYGQNCSQSCGQCKNGAAWCGSCESGFQMPLCQKGCQNGSYGENCLKACGRCLETIVCDHVNGSCLWCENNFLPPLCEACVPGQWGPACGQRCGHCASDGLCDRDTGHCGSQGCVAGWTGSFCRQRCNAGTYGANCSKACGHCSGGTICRHDNGLCDCKEGYYGILCQRKAEDLKPVLAGSVVGAGALISATIVCIFCFLQRKKKSSLVTAKDVEDTDPDRNASNQPRDQVARDEQPRDQVARGEQPAYDPVDIDRVDPHVYESCCQSRDITGTEPEDDMAASKLEILYQNLKLCAQT